MRRPWLQKIDLTKRILEIGPLCAPNIRKEAGANVYYADIRSTEGVKAYYQKHHPSVPNEEIVAIDYVLGDGTYAECFQNVEKFDYIVATHVIEHVPRLLLFFQDISTILNPKGQFCLAIPDKRYCLDHYRCPTSFAECYDIHMRGVQTMPHRVMDAVMNSATENEAPYWWENSRSLDPLQRAESRFKSAKDAYALAANGAYMDAHFSVFTPETFLLLLYNMLHSDLLPFRCVSFHNTEEGSNEFNCVLEFDPKLCASGIEREEETENLINLLKENNDTATILNSKTYRLAHKLRRIAVFMAPPNSVRRTLAKSVFRFFE